MQWGETMHDSLFQPLTIGTCKLSNRIVVVPVYTAYGSTRGYVTRAVIQHYSDMASGGAAMVVTENIIKVKAAKKILKKF